MFDYISAFETLEHMCDPIQKLRGMKRLLKPNGIIAVTVPSSDYFHFKFWLMRKSFLKSIFQKRLSSYSSFYEKQVLPHTHIYNFSRKSLWMMLENAGFIPHSIELTGWHGKYEQVIDNSMSLLSSLSGQRFNIAPSLFIIALNKI
jgi:2-polyprenyl-3-methyl-5-hydroxy-6-metoxy-1,4-benzoquinol methylase